MVVVDHPRKEKCSEFSKFEAYIMTLNSLSNSLSLALCNEAIERTLWWLLITAVDTVSRVEVVDNSPFSAWKTWNGRRALKHLLQRETVLPVLSSLRRQP